MFQQNSASVRFGESNKNVLEIVMMAQSFKSNTLALITFDKHNQNIKTTNKKEED